MKKLSLFLMTLFVLASCSNDEYSNPQTETRAQKVNFEIESNSFELTSSPLRSSSIPNHYLLQYVFYKETGEVFLNKVLYESDLTKLVTSTHVPLSIELPEGKYHVAIMSTYYNSFTPESYIIKPVNYNTDYYRKTSPTYFNSNNEMVYYETFDLVVTENMSTQNIELKPMWSNIEFVIEDAKTFKVPEGTEQIEVTLSHFYDGFYIKSKLSRQEIGGNDLRYSLHSLEEMRKENTSSFRLPTTLNEDRNVTVILSYWKLEATVLIDSRVIKVFEPENGKKYLLSGKLGNTGDSQLPLNITLGELDDEVINIPY